MILLHGDHPFQQHWLFFTSFKIYTVANSGSYILASDFYLRVLLCMVFAALATSFKRTLATLYFGKRNFETYKPKLEEILNDIIIISEIAELAAEADLLAVEEEGLSTERMIAANLKKRGQLSKARWSSVRFKKDKALDVSSDVESDDGTSEPITPNLSGRHLQASESSKKIHIKNLLDRWEDPLSNKQSKVRFYKYMNYISHI